MEKVGRNENSLPLFSLGGDSHLTLVERVRELEAENWRLHMAIALLTCKKQNGRRGRPKNKLSDAELLYAIELLMVKEKAGSAADVLRKMHARRPVGKRLPRVKLEQEIKTIQNAISRARKSKGIA